jgi:hypothetical protein
MTRRTSWNEGCARKRECFVAGRPEFVLAFQDKIQGKSESLKPNPEQTEHCACLSVMKIRGHHGGFFLIRQVVKLIDIFTLEQS